MKILLIHHLEPTWENGYKRQGESFESIAAKTIAHILESEYDKVILTQFENWQSSEEHETYIYLPDFVDFDTEEDDEDSGWDKISNHVNQWEQYGYGATINCVSEWALDNGLSRCSKNDNWAGWSLLGRKSSWDWGGNHSEVVELPEWLHDLKHHDISLCGAFDGECIEDMEIALDSVGANFQRIENLII